MDNKIQPQSMKLNQIQPNLWKAESHPDKAVCEQHHNIYKAMQDTRKLSRGDGSSSWTGQEASSGLQKETSAVAGNKCMNEKENLGCIRSSIGLYTFGFKNFWT